MGSQGPRPAQITVDAFFYRFNIVLECADAQADINFRCVYMLFCSYCLALADVQYFFT